MGALRGRPGRHRRRLPRRAVVRRAAVAGVLVLVAAAGGLGAYFALRGSAPERPPVGRRNPILERAIERGVIGGYHVVGKQPKRWDWGYEATGGSIALHYYNTCAGSCPAGSQRAWLSVEYRQGAATRARELMRIARALMPYAIVKVFETTTLGG